MTFMLLLKLPPVQAKNEKVKTASLLIYFDENKNSQM